MLVNILSVTISIVALAISLLTYLERQSDRKLEYARAVSISESPCKEGLLNEENQATINVHNSSSAPIRVLQVGILVGDREVHDRQKPFSWLFIAEHDEFSIEPHSSKALPRPDDPAFLSEKDPELVLEHLSALGPAVVFEDARSEMWLRAPGLTRNISNPGPFGKWSTRREALIDNFKWLQKLFDYLSNIAIHHQDKHPGRLPILPMLISWIYAWKIGPIDRTFAPIGAPLGWAYAHNAWDNEINEKLRRAEWKPRYSWKSTDESTH